jgi:hypothetical protein
MDVSREAQNHWPRTPRGKVMCPECGRAGYLGGSWTHKHEHHETCTCGKVVSHSGLATHRTQMARYGKPCP